MLDLEDAVAAQDKDAARAAVDQYLSTGVEVLVRVNGTDTTWCVEDLQMLARRRCGVMIPKAHSASQLQDVVESLGPGIPLVALIETAAGVSATAEICGVGPVVRAAFGSIDLGAELGVDPEVQPALHYARSAVVLGSAAAGLSAPLDGVTTDLSDDGPLTADVAHAAGLGFTGKLCIHPRQVGVVNALFSPSLEQVEWARKVTAGTENGKACVIDGKMVDKPVVDRARRILLQANR